MTAVVKVETEKTERLAVSRDKMLDFMSNVEQSVGKCFPDLRALEHKQGNVYHLVLGTIKVAGLKLDYAWDTEYFVDREQGKCWWKTLPDSGNGGLDGEMLLKADGDGTVLTLKEILWNELPISKLMVPLAKPVTLRILNDLTERYLANIRAAVEG
jgi:carbon monoxide dehydrogenase subunit G